MWSTIKAMAKLEWYDFGLEKTQKLKKCSKNSIRHPCLNYVTLYHENLDYRGIQS